jgi:hypothetical protein
MVEQVPDWHIETSPDVAGGKPTTLLEKLRAGI